MPCPCSYVTTHKHGKTSIGTQRHFCLGWQHIFPNFDTLYYRRQLKPEKVHTLLQSYCEGSSLRGVVRIGGRIYGTVIHLIRVASRKARWFTMLLVNARIGDEEKNTGIYFFVNNLFDKEFIITAFTSFFADLTSYGDRRTFWFQVRATF